MSLLSAVLAIVVVMLSIALLIVNKLWKDERVYLRDAVFESWVRETKSQCRKWAMYYKKIPPIVEVGNSDQIKEILISNLDPISSKRILLAKIKINFGRHLEEIYVCYEKPMTVIPKERWAIVGGTWSPKNLILRDSLWECFYDDPNALHCEDPNHIGALAAHN